MSLPCGRCIGCRLERARQWAVRLMHEESLHDDSCFVTLTYTDDALPKDRSIHVKDAQDFLKRLRWHLRPKKIRHFLVGEYGDKLGRPHYHAIIFGHSFPEKTLSSRRSQSHDGRMFNLYESEALNEIWGKGDCFIGNVEFDSAAYVAKYSLKKVSGEKSRKHYNGRTPEFSIMSRGGRAKGGGIGNGWFNLYASDVYPSDEVIVNSRPARPPRYYDRLLAEIDPVTYEVIGKKRETAASALEEVVNRRTGEIFEVPRSENHRRLQVREKIAEAKSNLKKRRL